MLLTWFRETFRSVPSKPTMWIAGWLISCLLISPALTTAADQPTWIRTAQNGPWSATSTWESGKVPGAGARVHIRTGHAVVYDVKSDLPIRAVCIAGRLSFAADRNTQLNVGVLKIEAGDEPTEEGFDCTMHFDEPSTTTERPALEVGTVEQPIAAGHTALIRLAAAEGQDKQSCPAIICCAGRMDFHGAPLSRSWLKLGATSKIGDQAVTLEEAVTGWRVGDRVIVTATKLGRDNGAGTDEDFQTETRTITALDGAKVTFDKPLIREHLGTGEFRGEVANLSRNVIVESANPDGDRGHTMYHRGSAGSISYAEFRHLGKKNVLGRYALHYHLVGNTMRGSSVVGASIWDSHNRWLTIHGTNYLVVRDCVGFRSIGHGFFMEDGTEVLNVLDRNLAVQSIMGRKLPKQVLPFDQNEGSGFWWANSLNTFTRNVACENERYGFRYEATETSALKLTLPVQQADGKLQPTDIRTLPFVRFEDNEAHCDGLYGINIGEGVNRVGPDAQHPFVMRNTKIWEIHYAFRPQSPSLLVENLQIHNSTYGVYHPNFDRHVYRNVVISQTGKSGDAEPFNRGHDDDATQYGTLTVDGLKFVGHQNNSMPLIQISDQNPTGTAESHFRNVAVLERRDDQRRALVNLGGGPRPQPKYATSVPVYLHDFYGSGRHAKVVSVRSGELKGSDAANYKADPPLTGDESRVAEIQNVNFPELLNPKDDLPPATIITRVWKTSDGWHVRGETQDNGGVREVLVNGAPAKSKRENYAEWEIVLAAAPADGTSTAVATDDANNVERVAHVVQRK
jgi:hypothetical protein